MLTKTKFELSSKKFRKVASIFAIAFCPINSLWAQCSAPSVTGTTICAGQIANLTPSPVVANASYDWYNVATGGIPIQTANSFTPQLSTTTTYYVAARTSACTSTRTAVTVKVNPLPADGFFTVSKSSVCTGGYVGISINNSGIQVTVSPPSTFTYVTGSYAPNPPVGYGLVYQGSETGVFTATATTSLGCSKVISQTVTVNPIPTVTLSKRRYTCEDAVFNLITNAVAGAIYTWTGPNNFTTTTTSSTLNVSNAITLAMAGNYTVNATVNGCTSSTASCNLSVNPKLVAPVIDPSTSMCFQPGVSKSITITAATINNGAYWTTPVNFTQTYTDPDYAQQIKGTFNSAVPGQFSVYTKYPACASSPITTFTMYPNPTPIITAAKFKMCKDETVQLVADAQGGTWSISSALPALTGGAVANSTISSAGLFTGNNPGLYTVRYTVTVNGCAGYSEKDVTVGALPFTITGADKMCQNKSAVYTVVQPGEGNSYSWKVYQNPNTPISGPSVSDFNSLVATLNSGYTAVGTVLNLSATGAFECIAAVGNTPAVYKYSDASKIVTIVASPSSSDILLKCADASCNTLTATMRDGSSISGFTFRWYNYQNSSIGNTLTVNNPKSSGGTYCEVTNANGCSNTYWWQADFTNTCLTGTVYDYTKAYYCNQNYAGVVCPHPSSTARMSEINNDQLAIVPNPVGNSTTFVTEGLEGTANLYNIDGVVVKTIQLTEGRVTFDLNTSTLQSGMYLLRVVYLNGQIKTAPLIKE